MELDYEKLEFKCGLEVHQQLEGKKLFCECLTLNLDKGPDVKFERRLRAVVGETGIVDVAAQFEMSKKKRFIYECSSQDTCLIEYDEEPPCEMNKEALETALKVALLLNARIVDEIQVMRKTVIDGSNVSGFQRTALIATNGFIETSLGKVRIPTICLEEEAAQKLQEQDDFIRYKLDRLGIPLIEVATSSDIKSAEHAKEAASHIGMILRSIQGIKRGIGTIRQDVNISIEKGTRVEIKGFQDLRSIPKVIEFEIKRQLDLIKKGEKISKEVRKAEPDFTTSFLRPMPGAARLYPETDVLPFIVKEDYLTRLKSELPKLLTKRTEEIVEKYKIPKDLAKELVDENDFEALVRKFADIEPIIIANTLLNIPKEIKTRFNLDSSQLKKEDFEQVLSYYSQQKIAKEAILDILVKILKNEKINLAEFKQISDKELEGEIKKLVQEKPGMSPSAYMGILMGKYRGKVDGKKIMELLKKFVK